MMESINIGIGFLLKLAIVFCGSVPLINMIKMVMFNKSLLGQILRIHADRRYVMHCV